MCQKRHFSRDFLVSFQFQVMNKDFTEYPWLSHAYICSNCGRESYQLFKYCSRCGKEFDWESALKLNHGHPFISDLEEMRGIFSDLIGLRIRLWDYAVSHAVLQLGVAHCSANGDEKRFNTVIISAGTERVSVSTHSWSANLLIETTEGKYGTIYKIVDKEAGFLLESSGKIGLYQNMPAVFFG